MYIYTCRYGIVGLFSLPFSDPSKKNRLQDESSDSQEEESIKRQKTD